MYSKTSFFITITLFTTLTLAAPTPTKASKVIQNLFSNFDQSVPTLPSSSLPSPSGTLQYVALGLGTQNYTCASPSASPVAAGAKANLYDATPWMALSGQLGQLVETDAPCIADRLDTSMGMRQIGMHYFNDQAMPSFNLELAGKGQFLQAKKIGDIPAPSQACTGRNGGKAVDWLFLNNDGSALTSGLSQVYRVNTAGGSPPACSEAQDGWVYSDYAAEYWFYQ